MNDCCQHNSKCRWAVGSNMPGYVPDSEVMHYANYVDALNAYIASVEQALDAEAEAHENGTGMEFDELCAVFEAHEQLLLKRAKKKAKRTEAEFTVGQYVYWISRM